MSSNTSLGTKHCRWLGTEPFPRFGTFGTKTKKISGRLGQAGYFTFKSRTLSYFKNKISSLEMLFYADCIFEVRLSPSML